jgi:D-arabinose 1-dehydrogenase-like Zn-dependent alcohol dehydrogenase
MSSRSPRRLVRLKTRFDSVRMKSLSREMRTRWKSTPAVSISFSTPFPPTHDINAYLALLARDGTLTLVGAPPKPLAVAAFALIGGRHSLSGSSIGSIAETQEMLDFCGEHNITADVEVIPIQKVNEAYERLLKSDVKYRFSIDMASIRDE